jgi:hypothetical protein
MTNNKKILRSANLFKIIYLTTFIITIASLSNITPWKFTDNKVFAENTISLEPYCKDGYYQIPGEKKCSRAPGCGGYSYDDLNKENLMPNPQDCVDKSMVEGNPPNTNTPSGYFPLCCYEMERTGDFTKCIGYWERLWCAVSQCDNAVKNGASDSQCGGCQCAHATKGYGHENVQPVPLEVRLHLTGNPTNTPTNPPSTSTPTITVTSSPTTTTTPTPTVTGALPASSPTPSTTAPTPSSTPNITPTLFPYPTTGPARLPKIPPVPYPQGPFCPDKTTCPEKVIGDANCDGSVNLIDFAIWKNQFDSIVPHAPLDNNANFSCFEGNTKTYYVDLVDFEIFRTNFSN